MTPFHHVSQCCVTIRCLEPCPGDLDIFLPFWIVTAEIEIERAAELRGQQPLAATSHQARLDFSDVSEERTAIHTVLQDFHMMRAFHTFFPFLD